MNDRMKMGMVNAVLLAQGFPSINPRKIIRSGKSKPFPNVDSYVQSTSEIERSDFGAFRSCPIPKQFGFQTFIVQPNGPNV